jgi:hypothetical protein
VGSLVRVIHDGADAIDGDEETQLSFAGPHLLEVDVDVPDRIVAHFRRTRVPSAFGSRLTLGVETGGAGPTGSGWDGRLECVEAVIKEQHRDEVHDYEGSLLAFVPITLPATFFRR